MTTTTIPPERLAWLDSITLAKGAHKPSDEAVCAEEAVARLAGEGKTDSPACASPVLCEFVVALNDSWDDTQRQKLKPYLVPQIGTAGDGQDEARSYLALDWLVRTYTPAWLDLAGLTGEAQALRDLRRIVDLVAARDAGPVVKASREKAAAARAAAKGASGGAWAAARDAAAAWPAAGGAAAYAAAAAWDAADAAWDAAAWAAASGAAARAALQPTVATLQDSALDLLARMIDPAAVTE